MPKKWGVTYSRPRSGTGMPTKERFQARPSGGAPSSTVLCCEISRFDLDSSRSYAKLVSICCFYLMRYFPNAAELIQIPTARQACCGFGALAASGARGDHERGFPVPRFRYGWVRGVGKPRPQPRGRAQEGLLRGFPVHLLCSVPAFLSSTLSRLHLVTAF